MNKAKTDCLAFPKGRNKRVCRPLRVLCYLVTFGKQPCDCVLIQLGTLEIWLIISYSREASGTKCDREAGGVWAGWDFE